MCVCVCVLLPALTNELEKTTEHSCFRLTTYRKVYADTAPRGAAEQVNVFKLILKIPGPGMHFNTNKLVYFSPTLLNSVRIFNTFVGYNITRSVFILISRSRRNWDIFWLFFFVFVVSGTGTGRGGTFSDFFLRLISCR